MSEALDVKQFNEDMVKLLAGERVELPEFISRPESGNTREITSSLARRIFW